MNCYKYIYFLLIVGFCQNSFADLLDPKLRDENISNSQIQVKVERNGDLFKYTYTIASPDTNKGIISSLQLDISCNLNFGDISIPVDSDRASYNGDKSKDGLHVPAEIFAAPGTAAYTSINASNYANWGVFLKPGNSVTNLYIVTPAPPGNRVYMLSPYMDVQGWDYSLYPEGDPDVPWVGDFTVSGLITGPACSTDIPPPPPSELFPGTGREPFQINDLLSYSEPVKVPVTIDNSSFKLTIYYSKSIEPKTFMAKLNGKHITQKFNPLPGTSETVIINGPWKKRNKLMLSVSGISNEQERGVSLDKRPDNTLSTPAADKAVRGVDEFKSKDTDIFYINLSR